MGIVVLAVHMTQPHLQLITHIGSHPHVGHLDKDRVRDTLDSDTEDIPSRMGDIHGMNPLLRFRENPPPAPTWHTFQKFHRTPWTSH
ncbi:hypothetical protein [Streptomyces sp. NPDC091219]|uniref:hypothetical protein n=1 Tax=Streptomyces sp. NPDC091219 TaxID=3155193 RepID=UPI00344D3197